jgi:hypothetical protein
MMPGRFDQPIALLKLQVSIPVPSLGTWPGASVRVEFAEALLSSMFVGRGGRVGGGRVCYQYDGDVLE